MSYPVFYVPAGDVLPILFHTFDGGTGASITMTGLAVTDIEIYKDGSTTQRASDAGYTLLDTDGIDFDSLTGIHGFSIDTGDNTDASFYTVGAWFHVVVSAITVDSQTVSFIACAFRLMPAEGLAGHAKVDVGGWLGTAPATPTTNGVPEVDITHIAGSAVSTTTAQLGVNVVQISTDATAADNLETALDDTAGAVPWFGILDQGTAQSATSTTLVLRSGAAFANDELIGATILITGGTTGVGQTRVITDYVLSTDTATVDTWTTTPSGTITYKIFASASGPTALPTPVNVTQIAGSAVSTTTAQLGVNVVQISADSTAADNCELMFDGTGYAGGTTKLGVDIVSVSGDTTAADNAELFFDGTGYNASNSTIGTCTALTGKTGFSLDSAEHTSIADALLKRDMSVVTGESARSPLNALRFLRNKWSISGTTLTVTEEDDSTTAWTATITATNGADPVTASDPA